MRTNLKLFFTFIATIIAVATSCVNTGPSGVTDSNNIQVSKVAASASNITIAWADELGDKQNYTVSVYTNPECSQLFQEYALTLQEGELMRFTVPYLTNTMKFYIVVKNATGLKSAPFEVALEKNSLRQEVLAESFDRLHWGYDYMNLAHGVVLNTDNNKSYEVDSLVDARLDSKVTTSIDDNGKLLFKYLRSMVEKMGMEGWDNSKEVRIMPGYVKLGTTFNPGVLKSPAFALLADATENINISFKAGIFASSIQSAAGKINASIVKADGTVVETKEFALSGIDGTPQWETCSFKADGVTSDCHLVISSTDETKMVCIDDIEIVRRFSAPEGHVYGYILDKEDGTPIANVAVSDGFSVVSTNQDGLFVMPLHEDAYYIYYTIPAEYEVTKVSGAPRFYTRVSKDVKEYNFELKKLPNGKEDKFMLFTFADIQVSNDTAFNRFVKESVPAIRTHVKSMNVPCYGITLGDIISNSDTTVSTQYMEDLRNYMRYTTIGLPVFQVMGNHDCLQFNKENPLDEVKFEIEAQRKFEEVFGPINYSFDRGDVHIVGMRDVVYMVNNTTTAYETGFLPEQYEWLKQDLALVPKDKMVVLCVHCPLYNHVEDSTHFVKEVHDLLNEFKEVHIISGHTHIQHNHQHESYNIYEHNTATICGAWWASNVCGDGTPNGYSAFVCEGNTFTDWYYLGCNEGMNTRDHQMRLYRGNAVTGTEKDSARKYAGYYKFNFSEEVILANVFNADDSWKIEVYEDDLLTGEMVKVEDNSFKFSSLEGEGTLENPYHINNDVEANYEMWVTGLHLSLNDKNESARGWTKCSHLFKFTLDNPNAHTIKVVATDRFGNRYEETKFSDYNDYSSAKKPN